MCKRYQHTNTPLNRSIMLGSRWTGRIRSSVNVWRPHSGLLWHNCKHKCINYHSSTPSSPQLQISASMMTVYAVQCRKYRSVLHKKDVKQYQEWLHEIVMVVSLRQTACVQRKHDDWLATNMNARTSTYQLYNESVKTDPNLVYVRIISFKLIESLFEGFPNNCLATVPSNITVIHSTCLQKSFSGTQVTAAVCREWDDLSMAQEWTIFGITLMSNVLTVYLWKIRLLWFLRLRY